MKDYLSYSQLRLYLENPQEYYLRYELHIKPEPSRAMKFGSIAHSALADRRVDYRKELNKEGYLPDKVRVIETALKQITKPKITEKRIRVKYDPIDLLSVFDAIEDETIREYKTGSGWWTQERVDEALQLTFYAFVYKIWKGRKPKKLVLYSINSKTGRTKIFETTRNQKHFDDLINKINYAYEGIKNKCWTL